MVIFHLFPTQIHIHQHTPPPYHPPFVVRQCTQANFVAVRDICRLLAHAMEQKIHCEIRAAQQEKEQELEEEEEQEEEQEQEQEQEQEEGEACRNSLLYQKPVKSMLVSSDAAFREEHPALAELDFSIRLNLHLLGGGSQQAHLNEMPVLDTDRIELRPGVRDSK